MIYNTGGCPNTHAPHAAQQQPLAAHPPCGPAVVAMVMVVVMVAAMMPCMAPVVVLCTSTCSRMCSSMQRRAGNPTHPCRAFAAWPRPAPGRVPGLAVPPCCSALAGSRPCTRGPCADRLVGVRCPCVAPVPCCTLGHAVPPSTKGGSRGCSTTCAMAGPCCATSIHGHESTTQMQR